MSDFAWDLTLTDRPLVEAKRWANRLRFAVMLLFFRARGRFPRAAAEVDGAAVAKLALSLGVPETSIADPLLPDAADRTAERQRAEIRALLGFREAGVADAEALGAWLRDNAIARTRDPIELAADAEARCRALRIEPPTPERIARNHLVGQDTEFDDRMQMFNSYCLRHPEALVHLAAGGRDSPKPPTAMR